MRARWIPIASLSLLFAHAACGSSAGPELPPDVGTSHVRRTSGTSGAEAEERPPAEPRPVGARVWANFRGMGFYFHGVVVERREEMHRVVYADGALEWLPADSLMDDVLDDGVAVQMRPTFEGSFQTATVLRRVGRAFYVQLAGGDRERWTSIANVRFQPGEPDAPTRDATPYVFPSVEHGEVGSEVLVDYQREGLGFAATVTARRDDGAAHVVYLDGATDWVDPGTLLPEGIGEGDVVGVRRSWEPVEWVRGRVEARTGFAFRVVFDDGGAGFTSLLRLRIAVADEAG